jgi:PAS domain S-box-containing protein
MHRGLQRQLKRIIGVADEAALENMLAEARALSGAPGLSPAMTSLLSGLGELLGRVDGAYDQYERDLALRTRSLELSSDELSQTNERLREELASRNRALERLRETATGLLSGVSAESARTAAEALVDNDLEALSALMARLVEARETERRELDNQKFALDQHAIVSITDTAGIILYANQRFCDISGYKSEELIGQSHRIVKSGFHPPEIFVDMWATISSGKVWNGEICNRRKDGGHYWVAATIVPFLDSAGLPTRYIGIRTDISTRKAMEAQLQEQLRLVEELIEAIPLPLYLKDTAGRYVRMNRAFELFFAVRREDMLGRTLHDLLRPEDIALHAGKDAELLATGGSQVYEAHVVSRDGLVHDTIYRKAVLTRPDGSASGLLGTIIDITERKEAELTLRRAMEVAEAANRAKSDFLANMSHEIRTPMNGVIGMTDLALSTDLGDEPREYLQIVKSSAESLLTIINDILDFSKIEAGKMLIERISFQLPRLVSDTVKTVALRAHEKGLELVLDVEPSLPPFVFGDPGRLRQVLLNLIGNAIKFTERGEVVVRVGAAAKKSAVHFEIRDTGVGIAEEKVGSIFEAFTQEDTSTTRRFGGTGLGLTISHRLTTMLKGRLWVESTLGVGSIFHVELPLEPDIGREAEAEDPASGASLIDLAGLPVMLVDDNETNRIVLSRMFASWGMRVSAFGSARELLAVLEQEALPKLIALDAHMPEMDGFDLAKRLQADPRLVGVPRIMLSSGAMRGDAERCRELGIAAYFSKPVGQQELLAGLHSLLGLGKPKTVERELVTRHTLRESQKRLQVLLVEDHPINQKLAISLLEKWGHEVRLAENGEEALDLVAGNADGFDVILMDLQMPGMGGLEATKRLRLAGCRTHIVAMTANAMEGDRELCLAAGMDDYIAKPIKADDLYAQLHRLPSRSVGALPGATDGVAFDYARALASADPEIVEVITPLFLADYGADLARLQQALREGDGKLGCRMAHTLRSIVGNFKAEPTVQHARAVEDALHRNDIETAASHLPALTDSLAQLAKVLREHSQVL